MQSHQEHEGAGTLVIIPLTLAFIFAAGVVWGIPWLAHQIMAMAPGIALVRS